MILETIEHARMHNAQLDTASYFGRPYSYRDTHNTYHADRLPILSLMPSGTFYDYERQSWVKDGVYTRCGHPEAMACDCYGRIHAGESYTRGR